MRNLYAKVKAPFLDPRFKKRTRSVSNLRSRSSTMPIPHCERICAIFDQVYSVKERFYRVVHYILRCNGPGRALLIHQHLIGNNSNEAEVTPDFDDSLMVSSQQRHHQVNGSWRRHGGVMEAQTEAMTGETSPQDHRVLTVDYVETGEPLTCRSTSCGCRRAAWPRVPPRSPPDRTRRAGCP